MDLEDDLRLADSLQLDGSAGRIENEDASHHFGTASQTIPQDTRGHNASTLPNSQSTYASDAMADFIRPFETIVPRRQTLPIVLNSPHSGRVYPKRFLAASHLDPLTLRRSEDSFVDEIFEGAVAHGAPLLKAHFPRAYLDVNREPYELDPAMFHDPLPAHVNTRSHRVAGGLGTIARIVADQTEIYKMRLPFSEAEARIRDIYMPFHETLRLLLETTFQHFGKAILIDCHSMPSAPGVTCGSDQNRPDIVLGDRYGTACAPALIDRTETILQSMGYRVARNNPYAGGFNTEHYGAPSLGLHALQIEINRTLYMNETSLERTAGLTQLSKDMTELVRSLGQEIADGLSLEPHRRAS